MNILERDPKGTCMYASVLDLESLQNCFGSKRTLILIVFPHHLILGGGMSLLLSVGIHPCRIRGSAKLGSVFGFH